MTDFTEEQALKMDHALDHFLIKLEDNKFGIRFNGFRLRDLKTGKIFNEYYPKDQLVKNLVLLERHYIEGKLAANFRFVFPAFIPKSSNDVEFICAIPKLSPEVQEKLKKGEDIHAESDTFVFVDGKLNVHRRAKYTYYDAGQEKEN